MVLHASVTWTVEVPSVMCQKIPRFLNVKCKEVYSCYYFVTLFKKNYTNIRKKSAILEDERVFSSISSYVTWKIKDKQAEKSQPFSAVLQGSVAYLPVGAAAPTRSQSPSSHHWGRRYVENISSTYTNPSIWGSRSPHIENWLRYALAVTSQSRLGLHLRLE